MRSVVRLALVSCDHEWHSHRGSGVEISCLGGATGPDGRRKKLEERRGQNEDGMSKSS